MFETFVNRIVVYVSHASVIITVIVQIEAFTFSFYFQIFHRNSHEYKYDMWYIRYIDCRVQTENKGN